MPTAANHIANADPEKRRIRRGHEASISTSQRGNAGCAFCTGELAADIVIVLSSSATQTVKTPALDPTRIRAGARRLVVGAVLVLNGFGLGCWFTDATIIDFASFAVQIGWHRVIHSSGDQVR